MLLLHSRDMFLTHLLLKQSMRCVQEGYASSQGKQVQSSSVHEYLPTVSAVRPTIHRADAQ